MTQTRYAVVGGGIVGAAVASRLLDVHPDASVTVLEKEDSLAGHQTGRNSGVVHAGLYYTPGSLKARLCRQGVGMLKDFCSEHRLPYQEIGKVLVALDDVEAGRLASIQERAEANGVPGVRRIGPEELRELEPHVRGVAGLHSPTTAIVDYPAVTRTLAGQVLDRGGDVRTGTEVVALRNTANGVELSTTAQGETQVETFDSVILCAGLHADRLARQVGASPEPRIMPFRGEYLLLRPDRRDLVRGLVYPVPDPRYPFLGVHLTPRTDGEVLIGPNAVLALAREGYSWRKVSLKDLSETVLWRGFAPFAAKNWRTGIAEMAGSLSTKRFVSAARRYVPELEVGDVLPGPSGIRAQAMDRDGSLVDDFRIDRQGRVVALRNAPSPAATSSLAIAEYLVTEIDRAHEELTR
ncbi:L-2-hydroxyglutarate oxidase [Ornithinicoccus hortensis]|uniref:L-2-hydroxyglutarate oxidase LhgO n=1 Tax=Ornithinicoccus hortensis TaxID=82346 RepID=A0A542YQX5_9MICO|nr:L-2-hydroxyglutarate oxidase [Ornithinicoccus hortensis]TQL50493.1 L-2-hydroxyglutarate oxidase LhgO [Ornithinicoccus hortensis]